eukprot:3240375-Rhodomonas_salina.2
MSQPHTLDNDQNPPDCMPHTQAVVFQTKRLGPMPVHVSLFRFRTSNPRHARAVKERTLGGAESGPGQTLGG